MTFNSVNSTLLAQNASNPFQAGVNYLSSGNRFYQTDAITEKDFAYFRANGVKDLSIRIFWKSVVEDPNVIPNYKRLLTIADKYDIKVQFDFWTQFSDKNWSFPAFIDSTYDIIRTSEIKNLWLDFISYVMNELKSHQCITSWTMMNEPFNQQIGDEQLFYQLWSQQYAIMKSIDDRPVSIRFALGSSSWSGAYSEIQVFNVCDYIAINEYLDPNDPEFIRWGANWGLFNKCLSDCKKADKILVISEFGVDSGSDEAKRVWYERSLQLFKKESISKAYAFAWQTLNESAEPFNIANKAVFQELSEANLDVVVTPSFPVSSVPNVVVTPSFPVSSTPIVVVTPSSSASLIQNFTDIPKQTQVPSTPQSSPLPSILQPEPPKNTELPIWIISMSLTLALIPVAVYRRKASNN